MKTYLYYILPLALLISCEGLIGKEDVVVVELPSEQNLVVVEGWVTDIEQIQKIRLTRSNNFSGEANPFINNASVSVQGRGGSSFTYHHDTAGLYLSETPFKGIGGEEYRLTISLTNGDIIRSGWNRMPPKTDIILLSVDNFLENDPDNPGQEITIFFPKITARDSAGFENFYRWIFYKNRRRLKEPESITLQNDRFFDGNLIPNLFDPFEYSEDEEMKVELHSINPNAFEFLNLLKSQITTLGASASTTPALVTGNMSNISNAEELILGFFGTTAIGSDSTIVENN